MKVRHEQGHSGHEAVYETFKMAEVMCMHQRHAIHDRRDKSGTVCESKCVGWYKGNGRGRKILCSWSDLSFSSYHNIRSYPGGGYQWHALYSLYLRYKQIKHKAFSMKNSVTDRIKTAVRTILSATGWLWYEGSDLEWVCPDWLLPYCRTSTSCLRSPVDDYGCLQSKMMINK